MLVKSVLSMDLARVKELIDTGISVNMALREAGVFHCLSWIKLLSLLYISLYMQLLFACFHRLNHAMAYLLADLFGIFAELIHSCSCVPTILIFSGRKERHRALLNLAPYSDLSAPESAWVSNSILPLSVYDFGDVLRSVTFRQTRMKKSAAVAFRLSRRWFRRRQIWTLATQEAQHL